MPQTILLVIDDLLDVKSVRDALHRSDDGSFKIDWVRSCAGGQQHRGKEVACPEPRLDRLNGGNSWTTVAECPEQ
jgi:hypothetical protein